MLKGHIVLLALVVILMPGCFLSYDDIEMTRAKHEESKSDFNSALMHYDRVIKRNPESETALVAAEKAANISFLETKNFPRTISYYRHIIMYSPDSEERYKAQKKIADIYFEKLNDYASAVLEYNKLLKLPHPDDDHYSHKKRIARSHFQLNDFFQSAVEVDTLLKKYKENKDKYFELNLFKASILLTTKKVDDAISIFIELLTDFPEKSNEENVPISLAIAYEEKKEFGKAIQVLKDIEAETENEEFIQLKIRRLEQRAANQPGARGLRR